MKSMLNLLKQVLTSNAFFRLVLKLVKCSRGRNTNVINNIEKEEILMTQTQVAYLKHLEDARHNREVEQYEKARAQTQAFKNVADASSGFAKAVASGVTGAVIAKTAKGSAAKKAAAGSAGAAAGATGAIGVAAGAGIAIGAVEGRVKVSAVDKAVSEVIETYDLQMSVNDVMKQIPYNWKHRLADKNYRHEDRVKMVTEILKDKGVIK